MTGTHVRDMAARHGKKYGLKKHESYSLIREIEEEVLYELTAGRYVNFAKVRFRFKLEGPRKRFDVVQRTVVTGKKKIVVLARIYDSCQKVLMQWIDPEN